MTTQPADPDAHTRRHLRLVADQPAVAAPLRPAPVSLNTAPFRPGELPIVSWLPLCEADRTAVTEQARAAGLPAELWVRIAVEAARLVDEIATVTGRKRAWLVERLDAASLPAGRPVHESLDGNGLVRYAAELKLSQPTDAVERDFPLRLPEEMTGQWRSAARRAGTTFPAWVVARLAHAPERCVDWEIASASGSRTLAEWAYAASLAAIAESSAAAQRL